VKGLHNILYSYSTDKFASEEEYLERWPGDDFVDLIGYDDYHNFAQKETVEKGINSLRILARLGQLKNKPFALTETGLEMIPVEDWWTENILKEIKSDSMARKASYFLVWRNGRPDHYYAPYPGQLSADDFIQFERDTFTWFLEDLPNMFE
jgi:mannan endo-1,4-beta-mannosidase